nr:HlyD family efflux transporter periplasmic adaptor subunit [Clostridium saccharobutylicum]
MLEAKPNKFTSIFAYGLISILAAALIWSYFGQIDIVTKTNGVVKSKDKTISVLNEVDGKVAEVNFKEGQNVKEGDILYTLECKDMNLTKDNYEKQLETVQADTDNINKLRNSILENKNYFDVNNEDEKDYYNKYLQYSTTNEKLSLIQKQTGLQTDATNATEKIQADLEKAKATPELDDVNKELATNDITKYKIDTLVKLDDSTKENEKKIDELKNNIETLKVNIDKSTVKATIDGVINVKADIAKGQLVKTGEEILSVIPQDSSQYKVKLYVSNKDIAGIKVGQKIKYHFEALPYKEYGELSGTITDIATDATVDAKTGTSYYLVESEIENKPLFSYKGEEGELKMGMTCEAQVVTKQKKILYYLLEKINLKN